MKEYIEAWKKENGNSIKYTTKEILAAFDKKHSNNFDKIEQKIEKILEVLNEGEGKIGDNRKEITKIGKLQEMSLKWGAGIVTFIMSCLGGLLYLVLIMKGG